MKNIDHQIAQYQDLLELWNKTHNLYSRQLTPIDLALHIQQSLFFANTIAPHITGPVLDLGSGNGLPGVLISLITPHQITLTDPVHKKAIFLNHVIHTLKLNAVVFDGPWEKLTELSKFKIMTSRAFSSLTNLINAQENVSRETSDLVGYYLKGKEVDEEIKTARNKFNFECDVLELTNPSPSWIVRISKITVK